MRVTGVRLDTPTFTGPVEAAKDSVIGPGVSADLTLELGGAACDHTDQVLEEHVATVEVEGRAVELVVAPDVLRAVRDERCRVLAVTDRVALAVAPGWDDAGEVRGEPALRGTVVATPRAGAGDVVLSVEGATTLFTVAEPVELALPPGTREPGELPVVLTVTRCDAHAVAEDKKGYLLPVRVSLDGADEVLVEVAVPVPERGPLQQLVDRTCS